MPRGCPRPKGPKNPAFCDFPPLGVRSVKTQNAKKLRGFREKLFGACFPPPKVPLAPGNRVFLFSAYTRNFTKCLPPKTGQNTTKSPFPPRGGPTGKKARPAKVAETIPDSVVTFFSIFGPPTLCRPKRALWGLLLSCLLSCSVACLLARRPSSTLVS